MARNEQLVRQLKILQILERRRFGASLDDIRQSLVDELGLSSLHVRSVRRDLEALSAAGFDIHNEDTQSGKVWKLRRSDKGIHKLNVSASELIALSMGRDLLLPLLGTQFWQGIEGFWNKVREQLPSGVWELYQRYRRTLHVVGVPSKTYEKQHGILKTINRAIEEHRILEIEYQSSGKPLSLRRIEPYGLAIFKASIYVVAIDSALDDSIAADERLRHWKLDRFEKATALDEWFKPSDEVDLEEHLGQSIGIFSGDKASLYVIKISANAARWIREEPWHDQQLLEARADGSFTLTVPAYHSLEVIPKVLELGTEAEILSPKSCRNEIKRIVLQLAEVYQS